MIRISRKAQLKEQVKSLQSDLANSRQNLDNQQSERARVASVTVFSLSYMLLTCPVFSQLEAELNEKLGEVYNKLMQAGTDQRETEREIRLRETLSALQRIFPGVKGRITDLCRPTQRKYETAVATVLGRNIDAVVVDEEKTAIDCIEVSSTFA